MSGDSEEKPKPFIAITPPKFSIPFKKEDLLNLVQSLEFIWFLGNLITVIGCIPYVLTYFKISPEIYDVMHNISVIGAIISFGVLTFQNVQQNGFNLGGILKDDNTHYLFLAVFLISIQPYVLFTVLPFGLFSIFHVLIYVVGNIFPLFEIENSYVSTLITSFINMFNNPAIQFASAIEILALAMLVLRVITFRSNSLIILVIYSIFLKVRYETSQSTRDYVKYFSGLGDKVVATIDNPTVSSVWSDTISGAKSIDKYKFVNDYSKEGKSE